jgi:HPt (histidine-containing phosphotransfer) domain-containing protein
MEANMIKMERVDQLLEELSFWGCNIEEAMDRLMHDKAIFIKFLYQFKEDEKFKELDMAVRENDKKKAFECAHALKGVAGNLSINPIYDSISLLVEVLRKGEMCDAIPILEMVLAKKKELCEITEKAGLI